tara:strand:- start:119 stop:313 length:195 start_codon:yes stop_codon:yes gene_type:complete
MIPPSYAQKSDEARKKYHMDDDFESNLKDIEDKLDRWDHSMELGHAIFTLLNTALLIYLILKLT